MTRNDNAASVTDSRDVTPSRFAQFWARSWRGVAVGAPVVGVIAVGFRSSWGALRDAALAAHMDPGGADLYPVAVDGLVAVAIIAMLLLRRHPGPMYYCLGIIISFTGASLFLNHLHGLGWFSPDPLTEVRPAPPWPVVLVIASLVVLSIALGSHLLVMVLQHGGAQPTSAHNSRKPAGERPTATPEVKSRVRSKRATPRKANPRFPEAVADCLARLRAEQDMRSVKDLTAEYGLSSDRQGHKAQKAAKAAFEREQLAAANGHAGGASS